MAAGLFHEHMIAGLESAFREKGCNTFRQFPSRPGRNTGYIDLLVELTNDQLLVIEVEMSPRRAVNDVRKRNDLGNRVILWIVVPNSELKTLIWKRLQDSGIREKDFVFVFTYGQALQEVPKWVPFCPVS